MDENTEMIESITKLLQNKRNLGEPKRINNIYFITDYHRLHLQFFL